MNTLYVVPVKDVLALWSADERPAELVAGAFEPRGQAIVLRVDGDTAYVHGTSGFTPPKGWTVVAEHVNDADGWKGLYAKAPEHARKLLKARVRPKLVATRTLLGEAEEADPRVTVTMDQVKVDDVVKEDQIPPHYWME